MELKPIQQNSATPLFPYEKIRDEQKKLISDVRTALAEKKHLLAHAPTGLGKTAATLAPALNHVLEQKQKKLIIFFLTARHTQHAIALETLRQIKEKHHCDITVCDIIGKKHMCAQPGANLLPGTDFTEYCKKVREDGTCEFYQNCRAGKTNPETKLTVQGEKAVHDMRSIQPCNVEVLVEACKEEKVCPYEITLALAKQAQVVIADYAYMFHPTIRDSFLAKIGKELSECIIIVDEGHNLPARVREMMTEQLSSIAIKYAIKEAKKFGYVNLIEELTGLQNIFLAFTEKLRSKSGFGSGEMLIAQKEFGDAVNAIRDYDELIADYQTVGDAIRGVQRRSFIASIASFLEVWKIGKEEGFSRIFSVKPGNEEIMVLSYRCLDPSLMTRAVFHECYASIIMSGTLNPTSMYKDLLGYETERCIEATYDDPFIEDNRLALVIPETTTKFALRSEGQFRRMAEICATIVNAVPGNSAIFFPSYDIRNKVHLYLNDQCTKTLFIETPGMTKQEKTEMLERFKQYNKSGAVLLGAISGNFAEGIDLPGDLLKGVVVVGLPLSQPDLETRELIKYYDAKFGRGWDYGYIFPAFIKCLQGAGRCIRTETDRGVVVFLDERYTWPRYARCFPQDYGVKVSQDYAREIEEFFG